MEGRLKGVGREPEGISIKNSIHTSIRCFVGGKETEAVSGGMKRFVEFSRRCRQVAGRASGTREDGDVASGADEGNATGGGRESGIPCSAGNGETRKREAVGGKEAEKRSERTEGAGEESRCGDGGAEGLARWWRAFGS